MKEEKKNFRAMLKQAGQDDLESGVEGAMFGRFVTSDVLARTDASVHVAHAMTVHPIANEVDYFTVVDDLDDNGAAHAGDMELGAGLFYNYVVVDVPLLVSNISGCERWEWAGQTEAIADARDIIEGLARAIATVSPGAKLGATAPYARAEAVLFEAGKAQPRTLANSYLNAIKPNDDMMQRSVDALGAHLTSLDDMYGVDESRFLATTRNPDSVPVDRSGTFPDMTRAAMDQIFGAS
jgi:CRISPR system Cascade subunit CasC